DKDTYSADQVGIYWHNKDTGKWERQDGNVNEKDGTVTIHPSHFSTYGVFAATNKDGKSTPVPTSTPKPTASPVPTATPSPTTTATPTPMPNATSDHGDLGSKSGGELPNTSTGLYNWM